jgi:hypothetical protein
LGILAGAALALVVVELVFCSSIQLVVELYNIRVCGVSLKIVSSSIKAENKLADVFGTV